MTAAAAAPVDLSMWGKLGSDPSQVYPVLAHMLDTSAALMVVWERWLRPGLRDQLTAAVAPGAEKRARGIAAVVAGLHDVGKISKVFQLQQLSSQASTPEMETFFGEHRSSLDRRGYPVGTPTRNLRSNGQPLDLDSQTAATLRRHEALSLHILAQEWPGSASFVGDTWVGAVIGGHHGTFHPWASELEPRDTIDALRKNVYRAPAHIRSLTRGKWGAQQQAHIRSVLDACSIDEQDINRPLADDAGTTVILLAGLTTLADWLASSNTAVATGLSALEYINPADEPQRWLAERRRYFDSILPATLGVYEDLISPAHDVLGQHAKTPSELQQVAGRVGNGLWIATVPTGDGKTEAAMLRHATSGSEGLLFALPTRATTDAMFKRVRTFYRQTTVPAELLHAYASLDAYYLDGAGGEPTLDGETTWGAHAQEWLAGRARALLAPVSVGTVDQILLAALRQNRSYLRLLAVANRHVVLDETHTYDRYQARLLTELLAWWGKTGTRVTMLSASLPTSLLNQYIRAYNADTEPVTAQYPGWVTANLNQETQTGTVQSRREYMLRFAVTNTVAEDVVAAHVNKVREYRKLSTHTHIAVVTNTVDRCIDVARTLRGLGMEVLVLHSRMTASHRKHVSDRIEELRLKRGGLLEGVVVVGTQTIEASLDVDFDHMISDLAPTPSLIQRAGRLWRHSSVRNNRWDHRVKDGAEVLYTRNRQATHPVLDIIVQRHPTVPRWLADESRFPYLMAEQKRTLHALEKARMRVHVPTGVQELVDASVPDELHDIREDLNRGVTAGDLIAEETEALKRLAAAGQVVVPVDELMNPDVTYGTLSLTTTPDEFQEPATRFIEQDTADYLIIDPTGKNPWAFHGTLEQAGRTPPGTAAARALLGATLSLRESQAATKTIPAIDPDEWEPRAGGLKRIRPVYVPGDGYDNLLGLV